MGAKRDRARRRFDAGCATDETRASSTGVPPRATVRRMPIINVKVSAAKSAETSEKIARMLLEKTTRILRKRADLTAITIDYVDPEHWIVGGRSLKAQGRSSFYLDIKVVDETNTKAEKARYVAEVFEGFRDLLGDLHDESYVYVQDVRPTAYGFGGRTQEYRYQHDG
jgi:4-oxalocrotonate tautomerase